MGKRRSLDYPLKVLTPAEEVFVARHFHGYAENASVSVEI